MAVFVRLLGAPSVRIEDVLYEPAPSRGSALAFHLAYRGSWLDRGEACALLWPESDEASARASLRQVLHGLRAQPWVVGLETERSRLRWQVPSDVRADARAGAPADGDLPWADEAGRPLVLLDGFRLPDAPGFEAWLDTERTAVDERRRARLLQRAQDELDGARPVTALDLLDTALRIDPLDEPVVRLALQACRSNGRAQEAWARYQAFRGRLAAELGLEPAPETRTLVAGLGPAEDGPADAATLRAPSVAGPVATDAAHAATVRSDGSGLAEVSDASRRRPFVGREPELARLASWLHDPPCVVVVTGPGGMGKTRLASEAALRARGVFELDPVHVRLAEVRTAEAAAAAIANRFGMEDLGGVDPKARAIEALRDRHVVLVLDNAEQIAGIDALLRDASDACPSVAWLVTSRRRLDVPGRRTLTLGGLPHGAEDGGDVADSPAGRLFVARVREAGGDVDADLDAEAIATICRISDGMPLALELAAGWARVLSVAGVAERWADDVALEAVPGGDHEARHATVHGVLDASWSLLGPADRTALVRLTVFRGGCDVEAAELVAGVGLTRLAALRDASMIEVTSAGRVRMHPLVDRYVRHRASDRDATLDAVRARHARHYLGLLRTEEERGQRGSPREAVGTLQREHGNLEAAWAWTVEHGPWEALMAGGAFLAFSYALAGREDDWLRLLDAALQRLPEDHLSWAVLEAHAGSVDAFIDRYRRAYERCRRAAERARRHDDPWAVGWALYHHGLTALDAGQVEEGRTATLDAARLWTRAGQPDLASMAFQALHTRSLELAERDRFYRAGQAVRSRLSNRAAAAEADLPHGIDLSESHGRYGEALAVLGDVIATQRELSWNVLDLAQALTAAAKARILAGDLGAAAGDAEEALEIAGWLGRRHYFDVRSAVARMAEARLLRGEAEEARQALTRRRWATEMPSTEMHLVRGGVELALGDASTARSAAEAARSNLTSLAITRARLAEWTELLRLELRIALAESDERAARHAAAEALRTASRYRFLPATLHALALTAPLLPESLAQQAHARVRASAAAPFEARRLGGRSSRAIGPGRDAASDGTEIDALVGSVVDALAPT